MPTKSLAALFLTLICVSHLAQASWSKYVAEVLPENLCKIPSEPAVLEEKLTKTDEFISDTLSALDRMTISLTISESIEFLEAFRISARYRYRAEPADIGKYFARIDRWRLSMQIRPLDFIDSLKDSVLGFTMDPGVEVSFMQLYDNVKDARKPKNGYSPARLPLTSKKALERLNPGDLVIFEGYMNLLVGVGDSWAFLSDNANIGASVGAQLSGRFRVFIFRGHDKLVRVRVAAIRSKNAGYNFRLGIDNAFDPIGSFARKPLVNLLDADEILRFGAAVINQDLFMGDYTLDLNSPDAVAAYDNLFTRPKRLNTLATLASPCTSDEDLRKSLVTNLSELNELAREDYDKDIKRAVVNFRGSNFTSGNASNVDFNALKLYNNETNRYRRDNFLTDVLTLPEGDQIQRYFFPSWSDNNKTAALFSWYMKERDNQSANIIYETNSKFQITRFHSIGFYRDISDNQYGYREHKGVLRNLRKILPTHVYTELKNYLTANKWYEFDTKKDNVRVSTRYFLHEDGMAKLQNMRAEEIENKILLILQRADEANPYSKKALNREAGSGSEPRCSDELLARFGITDKLRPGGKLVQYCNQIIPLSKIMSDSLNGNHNADTRHLSFLQLEKNPLFRYLGPSLIFELLPDDAEVELSYFEIVIAALDLEKPLVFKHGKLADRPLFEKLIEIERILNDDLPDMRLNSNKESKTEKNINQNLNN